MFKRVFAASFLLLSISVLIILHVVAVVFVTPCLLNFNAYLVTFLVTDVKKLDNLLLFSFSCRCKYLIEGASAYTTCLLEVFFFRINQIIFRFFLIRLEFALVLALLLFSNTLFFHALRETVVRSLPFLDRFYQLLQLFLVSMICDSKV